MNPITQNVLANLISKHFTVPTKSDDGISLEFLTTNDITTRIDNKIYFMTDQHVAQTLTLLGFKKSSVRKGNKAQKLWRVKSNQVLKSEIDNPAPKTKKVTSDETKFIIAGLRCLFGSNRIVDLAFQCVDRNDPASEFNKELTYIFDNKREQIHNIISIAFPIEYGQVKLYETLVNKLLQQTTVIDKLVRSGNSSLMNKMAKYFPTLANLTTAYHTEIYCMEAVLAAFDDYEQSLEDIDQLDIKVS